jgi:hypothetical protein
MPSDAPLGVRSVLLVFLFSPSTVRMPLLVSVRFLPLFFLSSTVRMPLLVSVRFFTYVTPRSVPRSASKSSAARRADHKSKSHEFARDLPMGVGRPVLKWTGTFYRFGLGTWRVHGQSRRRLLRLAVQRETFWGRARASLSGQLQVPDPNLPFPTQLKT